MKIPRWIAGPILLCAACQSYNPVAVSTLAPATDVRVTFTDDGRTEVTRLVGPRVSAVEGRILSMDTNAVRMAIRTLRHPDGSFDLSHDEVVMIPRHAIGEAEVRRISVGRSVLLAGAIVAGSSIAATQLENSGATGKTGAGGGSTPK